MVIKIKLLFGGGLYLNCDYGESYIFYFLMGDVGVFFDGNYFLEVV